MSNICTISMTFSTTILEFHSQKNTRGPKNTSLPRIKAYFCVAGKRVSRADQMNGDISNAQVKSHARRVAT